MSKTRRRERHDVERSLVGCLVGASAYAIQIRVVREIVNPLPLTNFPNAPAILAGVADHRGDVVPVIELRRLFGVPEDGVARRPKWILVEIGPGRSLGLVVDKVTEVFGTGGKGLRPAPELGEVDDNLFLGVTTHDGQLTFVLDTLRFARMADWALAGQIATPQGQLV